MSASINPGKTIIYAAIAALINSIIYLFAKFADASMIVNQGGSREIVLAMVFASSFVALVAAAYVVSFIGKKSEGFLTKAPLIGLIFGVVTAIAPFTVADDSKTAIALASNHIVAGVFWYIGTKRALSN